MAKENPWKEINDAFSALCDNVKNEIGTSCLICGEFVPTDHYSKTPKICKKCKDAVMKVREQDGN